MAIIMSNSRFALAAPFRSLFESIESGRIQALVTPITVAEVVSGPLKAGKDALAERYRRAITQAAHTDQLGAVLEQAPAAARNAHG